MVTTAYRLMNVSGYFDQVYRFLLSVIKTDSRQNKGYKPKQIKEGAIMKNTNNDVMETVESRELFLYATNTCDLYPMVKATVKNLSKHFSKGVYNAEKAQKSYYRLASEASNLYYRDFGYKFSAADKKRVAIRMQEYYFENVQNNDF